MAQVLADILDKSPWDIGKAILLLRNLASTIRKLHDIGDQWDQSEYSVIVADDFTIHSIGQLSVKKRIISETGKLDATRDHLAPEYLLDATEDFRSDIWAFGNIAYELITGKRPFDRKTVLETMSARLNSSLIAPSDLQSACSKDLSDLILRSLAREPNQRFQSMADLIEVLEAIKE